MLGRQCLIAVRDSGGACPYLVDMATWVVANINFAEELPAETVDRLNRSLRVLDYDTPAFDSRGLREHMWRSPLMPLADILDICHSLTGVSCSGSFRSEWADDASVDFDDLLAESGESKPRLPECNSFDLAEIRVIWGGAP